MIAALLLATALAHADAPLVYDFEAADTTGWSASTGTLAITDDTDHVRDGAGALQCSYTGQAGAPLTVTLSDIAAAGARSLSLSLNTSAQTPLTLEVAEADGSVYHTFITTLPGAWTDVEMPLTDLQLQDGSEDENDALDADQIISLEIQELCNLGGEMGEIFGRKDGDQTLDIDRVRLDVKDVPSRASTTQGKTLVDGFDSSTLHVLAVGGARLSHTADAEGKEGGAVAIDYTFAPSGPTAWPGVVVPAGHIDVDDPTAIRLRVKSSGPVALHVLLEERDGSRYEGDTRVEQGGGWVARDLKLSDVVLDPSRTDEDGLLNPDQLRLVVIVADCYNSLLDEKAHARFVLDDVLFLTR